MPITIDVTSSQGNAYAIIAQGSSILKQLDRRDEIDEFRTEAMSGDYDHVIATTKKYCGDLIEFTDSGDDEYDEDNYLEDE